LIYKLKQKEFLSYNDCKRKNCRNLVKKKKKKKKKKDKKKKNKKKKKKELGKKNEINILIEKYRTMKSKLIDNVRLGNDIVEL